MTTQEVAPAPGVSAASAPAPSPMPAPGGAASSSAPASATSSATSSAASSAASPSSAAADLAGAGGNVPPEGRKRGSVAQLLDYAGGRKALTYVGCALSALSMLVSFAPYVCIWFVARDLIAVAPHWEQATDLAWYGWLALGFAVLSILLYFAGLMCTHLAAFRCAANMRKQAVEHLMRTSLGYFDTHASGALRRVVDGCAAETEGLLAHKLPDTAGSVAMIVGMVALFFVFDWRLGLACLVAVILSILCMFYMMGGRGMDFMMKYQESLVKMNKTGTEYVRGIPVVKVFQQTVYSFKAFHDAIREFEQMATDYAVKWCQAPQSLSLTIVNGVAVFLIPVALVLAPGETDFASFLANFAFYAIFTAVIPTAMIRVMFISESVQVAQDALSRITQVMNAPVIEAPSVCKTPKDNSIVFSGVTFSYEGAESPALQDVSFTVPAGATVALVGPSGGGKSTAAALVPRFWDVDEGSVRVGGVDVRHMNPHDLMDRVAFVFQTNRLFKQSIYDNVRAARPQATRDEVLAALHAAQCDDIIEKLPGGVDAVYGAEGVYLSGGEVQRLMLARAILKDAPIIVLDEATAFADPENEALIQQAFTRLAQGRTVLMIAHRLSTVRNADAIVVLDSGWVVETGTHDELVEAQGRYARMWADYGEAVAWRISTASQVEGACAAAAADASQDGQAARMSDAPQDARSARAAGEAASGMAARAGSTAGAKEVE